MLHVHPKYQGARLCGLTQDDSFMFSLLLALVSCFVHFQLTCVFDSVLALLFNILFPPLKHLYLALYDTLDLIHVLS